MSVFLKIIPASIIDKFSSQSDKSKIFLSNAIFSFFIKGISVSVNFLTVPLVLTFLNTTQYGIWLTLTAILSWFSLFDLGFGNGLRNRLITAIANKRFDEGKIYVSTTYAALSLIFGSLLVCFLIANQFINWTSIFNAPPSLRHDLDLAVFYAISLLFVQFVLRLINTVLQSFQRSAMVDFTNALVQVFILVGLYMLKITHYNSLADVALVYSVVPVAVFLSMSTILYLNKYKLIRPSIYFIKRDYIKSLLNLGLSFFVIQIAALVLYASDNFIITQFFNPSEVTTYNIAFKYFSVSNIIFSIVLAPFWSMTTQAHVEGDSKWIMAAVKKLLILWALLCFMELIQLAFSKPIFKLWTHNTVYVPFQLSAIMCVYFVVTNWGVVFANFLNGTGKIRIQLIYSVFGMIVNIPLAIFLIKTFNLGIIAVPLSTILVMIGGNTLASIQYKKIISKKAEGLWDK